MQQDNPVQNETPEQETLLENETPETGAAKEAAEPQKSELELLQEQHDALNDRYLRLMAEYDNFRKRSAREKDEIYGNAQCAAVSNFLTVLDNFERSLEFDKGSEDFIKGFEMIYTGFKDALSAMGVEVFGKPGDPFSPDMHNAVMHIEDKSLGENVVAQVLQKGYRMGERIIRHAMVQSAN